MTIDEAIEALNGIIRQDQIISNAAIQFFGNAEDMLETTRMRSAACNMAIAALRAQQEAERNEPLTYEEFSNEVSIHKDGWLWCVDLSGEGAHGWRKNENLSKYANITNYGKTWLAYRRPPVVEMGPADG